MYRGIVNVTTAAGSISDDFVSIEHQILTQNLVPLTPWFREFAVVKPDGFVGARLSGAQMRNFLFFATPLGNGDLYVARTRDAIVHKLHFSS